MRPSALLLLTAISFGVEAQERLISGPGSTLTENKCKICHELQHIRRSPLSRGEWADNLKNMKERGTPMTEAEQALILDYLSVYYNREKPAPAPSPDTLAVGGDPMQRLLESGGCTGCHAADKRVVGPSFTEIAARYGADEKAAATLKSKIRLGGQGAWGIVPMPPNPGLSDADLQSVVSWLLKKN